MRDWVDDNARGHRTVLASWLTVVLLMGTAFAILGGSVVPARTLPGPLTTAASSFTVSLSFSPNPVSANTQTNGQINFAGGPGPYKVWINNTAPGCGPQSNPMSFSLPQNSFTCTPTAAGTYNIHLDAFDNATPMNRASYSYTFTVQSSGGGSGTGNGSGTGTTGFSLPSELITTMITFAVIFFAGLFALAAGVIAMAVLISRRLRQLTEAMAPPAQAPEEPKKPST